MKQQQRWGNCHIGIHCRTNEIKRIKIGTQTVVNEYVVHEYVVHEYEQRIGIRRFGKRNAERISRTSDEISRTSRIQL
jgi:hypothetical protein